MMNLVGEIAAKAASLPLEQQREALACRDAVGAKNTGTTQLSEH